MDRRLAVIGLALVGSLILVEGILPGGVLEGVGETGVLPSGIVEACAGRDCTPAIQEPVFNSSEEAGDWLGEDELVIGVEHGGEARAYPLKVMQYHEVVNDRVGGLPMAVTYYPFCGAVRVYERTVEDNVTGLGLSGELWKGTIVMYDNATDRVWSQLTGRQLRAEGTAARLNRVDASVSRFGDWVRQHPETRVLARESGRWGPGRYTAGVTDRQPGTVNITATGIEGIPAMMLGVWCGQVTGIPG